MPRCRTLVIILLTSISVGAFGTGLVHAQATSATPPATRPAPADPRVQRIGRMLDDLTHADAAVRDRALGQMMRLRRSDLPVLRDLVAARRPLAPTQSEVLHDVVVHVFLRDDPYESDSESGFLGINAAELPLVALSQDPDADAELGGTGVPIGERIPGFDAFAVLRSGDVVLGVRGPHTVRLSDWNELVTLIQNIAPGQMVTLEVLRQGQVIAVPLMLSPRPMVARDDRATLVAAFFADREKRAEAYWAEHFAPLLSEPVS